VKAVPLQDASGASELTITNIADAFCDKLLQAASKICKLSSAESDNSLGMPKVQSEYPFGEYLGPVANTAGVFGGQFCFTVNACSIHGDRQIIADC
jgi:hypothetical protein